MERNLCEIWRVQNEYGGGPYNNHNNASGKNITGLLYKAASSHRNNNYEENWPGPDLSSALKKIFRNVAEIDTLPYRHRIRFGFQDIPQYKQWFDKAAYQKLLDTHNFYLCRLEIPIEAIYFDTEQVIFDKFKANITGFRYCTQSDIDLSIAKIQQHEPILQFMDTTPIPIELRTG